MKSNQRLQSLDALRGFDMLWIIGGEELFRQLALHINRPWAAWWAEQLEHVPWDGFHAYDLIFPLFMFIAGVAIPYSVESKLESGIRKSKLIRKVIKRAMILVVLGFIYNGLLDFNFETQRYPSVLGQIGISYLIGAVIVMNTQTIRTRIIWLAGILAGNAVIQLLIPVPGFGAGVLTPEGCINGFLDRILLPGTLYGKVFDPEGILCVLSASSVVIAGSLAGSLLRSGRYKQYKSVLLLVIAGISSTLVAIFFSSWYPFIKAAWTSTFNLLTIGISLLLLALFYLIVDVWKWQKQTFFLRVIGLNSITIYLATRIIDFMATTKFLFTGFSGWFGSYQHIILISGLLTVEWFFLYFLYIKKIFLKV
jgi:predicted acyltransferase